MTHNFDVEIAAKYGVNCAIILQNIYFWVEKNKANEKHFIDGDYWTYNSAKAFSKLFPYLSEKQISYALKKLEGEGLIKSANYNENRYDHTKWYALTKQGYSILQKGVIEETKGENLIYNNKYNNSKTDIKPNLKHRSDKISFQSSSSIASGSSLDAQDSSLECDTDFNADNGIKKDTFYQRVRDDKPALMNGVDVSYAFSMLYSFYPKRVGKREAASAFLDLVRENTKDRIIELAINIDTYKKYTFDNGTESKYIKNMQGFISSTQYNEYEKYNCDVLIGGKYYKTKQDYMDAVISGEVEMYLLPRSCITL